jgi:hypothetical protein
MINQVDCILPDGDAPPTYSNAMAEAKDDNRLVITGYDKYTMITINPEHYARLPRHIVFVMDISGSTGTYVKRPTESKSDVEGRLTILQLIKHSLNTCIETLSDDHYVSLVVYADSAQILMSHVQMDVKGKTQMLDRIKLIEPTNTTNIWDGIVKGLTVAQTHDEPGQITNLMVLTDGNPTGCYDPPRGYAIAIRKWFDVNKKFTINTSLFGYDGNSKLMKEIATAADGGYYFIPDGGFVGTIFINYLANTLMTYTSDASLVITQRNAVTFTVPIGSLQFQQCRNVVFDIDPATVEARLTYTSVDMQIHRYESVNCVNFADIQIRVHYWRQKIAELCQNATAQSPPQVRQMIVDMSDDACMNDPFAQGLLMDLTGEITAAVAPNAFVKWGRHYLPSLSITHNRQQRNNFKDAGPQFYGGPQFEAFVDIADDAFLRVEPQKSTEVRYNSFGEYDSDSNSGPVDMSYYNNSDGGCFTGNCSVLMHNGYPRNVSSIKAGHSIMTPNGPANVVCVIKTRIKGCKIAMQVYQSLLTITDYHPVMSDTEWVFPIDDPRAKRALVNCSYVYTFVLDKHHVGIINGHQVLMLGHQFTDGIADHDFFGNTIITSLQAMSGWTRGLIELNSNPLQRNSDGLVVGYRPNSEIIY